MFKINEVICTGIQQKTKIVRYCGYNFIVPYYTKYICVDEDGTIVASKKEPYIDLDDNFWSIDGEDYEILKYTIIFDGDWKESLVEI